MHPCLPQGKSSLPQSKDIYRDSRVLAAMSCCLPRCKDALPQFTVIYRDVSSSAASGGDLPTHRVLCLEDVVTHHNLETVGRGRRGFAATLGRLPQLAGARREGGTPCLGLGESAE